MILLLYREKLLVDMAEAW